MRKLGSGEFGNVWLARHKQTDLQLAVKVVHREAKKETQQQIIRELEVLHECNSPEIVNFYGAFLSHDGMEVNIVMEWMVGCSLSRSAPICSNLFQSVPPTNSPHSRCCGGKDGGCLDDVSARCGRIEENKLAKIFWKVLVGLKYLREKHNVIHRDIKPSNVLINSEGHVKLCDFGVSRECFVLIFLLLPCFWGGGDIPIIDLPL